jgi:cell division protein FtsI (penicillin-binding protein 3)
VRYRDQDELPFEGVAERRLPNERVQNPIPYAREIPPRQNFRSAGNVNDTPAPPQSEEQEAWHERLVERFFAAPQPVDPLKKNGRLYSVLALFLLAFALVGGKLFKLQVLDHGAFSQEAAEQYKTEMPIVARRGLIRDRNGIILAANAYVVKFAVDPKAIQHRDQLAAIFSETFGKPATYYEAIFSDTSRRYIVVEKEVPLEIASRLDSVKDHGLLRQMDWRRNYAFGERAAHVLGFASNDGRGLAGIELIDNRDLAGRDGEQFMQRDGRGALRPDVDYAEVPAADGENLTLTIDEAIQSAAETALKAGVEKAGAEAGIAIVMRPSTGEILALANVPDFDPNAFSKASNDMLRNRAITDAYEPGSTIKVLVASAALEDGAWKPDDKIDAEHGRWEPEKGVKITDTHEYGILTFREALEKSSNISFAKISDKLDKRRFYKYLRDFGIGNYTGIDLPGEVRGVLHTPATWQENSKRYMAFGYELTATPIQMATAYAAVANMGMLMKPYIIAKRDGPNGTVVTEPQEIRRVVSEQTCRTLINIMEGVVDSGTGTLVRIPGVRIAGKTGTAQQLVNGHWSKEHYTSSFTGFFPAEKPEYLISVILRSPKNGYYGGVVSGPIFREIAMNILEMNGKLPPEARGAQKPAEVPLITEGVVDIDGIPVPQNDKDSRPVWDVRGMTAEQGRSLLASQGFVVNMTKEGQLEPTSIIDDVIKCGGDTVRFALTKAKAEDSDPQSTAEVAPNLVGLPMARAIKLASADGFRVKTAGSGSVAKQFPDAGARLSANVATGSPTLTLFGEEQ